MARLQCPRCGTLVDEQPGAAPICPNCGFRGDAPPEEASGVPGGAAAPAASPYSTTPYGGTPGATPTPSGQGYMAPAPPGAPGYRTEPPTNAMAVASLVLSLVGLCAGITAILGIIFGHIGLKQCRERNEKGEGMALAGMIIGYIIVGLGVLWFIFVFLMLGMGPWWY